MNLALENVINKKDIFTCDTRIFKAVSMDFSCRFCLLSQELIISFDRKTLPWKQVFWRDRLEKHSFFFFFFYKHSFLSRELYSLQFSSVHFSRSVVSYSLRLHGLQHTRFPCPSPTPGVNTNSCPLSGLCHPIISPSVLPFFHLQSFPASESFQISQLKRVSIPCTCNQNVRVPCLCLNLGF